MAGFGVRDLAAAGLRVVPHPAVMVVLDFGAGRPVVEDAAGRQQRGSIVAGLGSGFGGAVRAWGQNIECVQVRLSPLAACAVLGIGLADLDGGVVALDDLWGKETARLREQLGDVSSWEDRFASTDAFLARQRGARSPMDPEVAWAGRRIVADRGLVRVEELAAESDGARACSSRASASA